MGEFGNAGDSESESKKMAKSKKSESVLRSVKCVHGMEADFSNFSHVSTRRLVPRRADGGIWQCRGPKRSSESKAFLEGSKALLGWRQISVTFPMSPHGGWCLGGPMGDFGKAWDSGSESKKWQSPKRSKAFLEVSNAFLGWRQISVTFPMSPPGGWCLGGPMGEFGNAGDSQSEFKKWQSPKQLFSCCKNVKSYFCPVCPHFHQKVHFSRIYKRSTGSPPGTLPGPPSALGGISR
jgi:hypothetical protein